MNMVYIACTPSDDRRIMHFGKKGQKWYERNYQSYEVAPTRSGKVGSEYGDAAREPRRFLDRFKKKPQQPQQATENTPTFTNEEDRNKKLGNYKWINENMHKLSNEDLDYAIKRLNYRKQMQDQKSARHQEVIKTFNSAMQAVNTAGVAMSTLKKTYNTFKGKDTQQNQNNQSNQNPNQNYQKPQQPTPNQPTTNQPPQKTQQPNKSKNPLNAVKENFKEAGNQAKKTSGGIGAVLKSVANNKDVIKGGGIATKIISGALGPTVKTVMDSYKKAKAQVENESFNKLKSEMQKRAAKAVSGAEDLLDDDTKKKKKENS